MLIPCLVKFNFTEGEKESGLGRQVSPSLQDKSEAEASEAPPGGRCRNFRELTLTI